MGLADLDIPLLFTNTGIRVEAGARLARILSVADVYGDP